jgi:hypothetical protein
MSWYEQDGLILISVGSVALLCLAGLVVFPLIYHNRKRIQGSATAAGAVIWIDT